VIVNADFKALEWVTALDLSNDEVGIAEWYRVLRGEIPDIHTVNQVDLDLPERRHAKIFLFRIIYGGTQFANDPMFSHISSNQKWWDKKIERLYNKYQGLGRWHVELVETVTRRRVLEIPTGRQYTFSPYKDRRGELKWPRTKILNYPVQGYASEMVKLARIALRTRLMNIPDALFVSSVHDSLVVDCPNHLVQDVCGIMYQVMHSDVSMLLRSIFGVNLKVPLTGDIGYGPNQKELKEWVVPSSIVKQN